jgi:hypothetical protein
MECLPLQNKFKTNLYQDNFCVPRYEKNTQSKTIKLLPRQKLLPKQKTFVNSSELGRCNSGSPGSKG